MLKRFTKTETKMSVSSIKVMYRLALLKIAYLFHNLIAKKLQVTITYLIGTSMQILVMLNILGNRKLIFRFRISYRVGRLVAFKE